MNIVDDEEGRTGMDPGISLTDADRTIRSHIIDLAIPMFLEHGYVATTADAVARAAGMSKKTLYRLFPSKEHLLATCVTTITAGISDDLTAIYHGTGSLLPRIEAAIAIIGREYGRIRAPQFLADARTAAPAVWSRFMAWRSGELIRFSDLLRQGIHEQIVHDRYSIDDISRTYTVMIFACMEHLHGVPQDGEPGAVYRTFIDMFFHGLAVTPPTVLPHQRPWVTPWVS